MRQKRLLPGLMCALLCLTLLGAPALAVVEPTPEFYVADYADVIDSDTEQYIIDQNKALAEATGGEIVVVAVDFMDGMSSGDYAMAVTEAWGGIGSAERNNGFILVFATGENKVRAMAGSGIERALSASKLEGYLEDYFYDDYDAGAYDSAVRAFFDAIYGWYEDYYSQSSGVVAPPVEQPGYYPTPKNDHFYGFIGFNTVVFVVVMIIVVAALCDRARYSSYRRRYYDPGMPNPPRMYRPIFFGWGMHNYHRHHGCYPPPPPPRPHSDRRPPTGGGGFGGGSGGGFRGGGAGRGGGSGGGFGGFGGGRGGGGFGGGFGGGGGGGFRGGGAGRG